jgi:hypothetical protein
MVFANPQRRMRLFWLLLGELVKLEESGWEEHCNGVWRSQMDQVSEFSI